MKKLIFILLSMSMGLAATAVGLNVQPVQMSKKNFRPDLTQHQIPRVTASQMSQLQMCDVKNALPINQFFTQCGVTPDDNMLMKRAPCRVAPDFVQSSKIAFLGCCNYNFDAYEVELAKCYYQGGWDVSMVPYELFVPALQSQIRGDVDGDNAVGLNDVVLLIDHLLSGDFDDSDHFLSGNADVDMDATFSLNDVVALITLVFGSK